MNLISAADFWPWAYSDFLSNTLRGVLAEYIVACAAGCAQNKRVEWDAYDLITADGLKIEVKSSAYLQSWVQKQPSPIRFDIAERRADTTVIDATRQHAAVMRRADVYVFCVFSMQEREKANPLELAQWFFLVCPTTRLAARFGSQKSANLSALEGLGLPRLDFAGLCLELKQLSGQPQFRTDRLVPMSEA